MVDETVARAFALLESTPDDEMAVIRQRYRDLRAVWHPDRFGEDTRLHKFMRERFVELDAALGLVERHRCAVRTERLAEESRQAAARRQAGDAPRAVQPPPPGSYIVRGKENRYFRVFVWGTLTILTLSMISVMFKSKPPLLYYTHFFLSGCAFGVFVVRS